MKENSKKPEAKVNFIDLFTEDQILNEQAMQSVRGGDGDGGGDIILFPPKP